MFDEEGNMLPTLPTDQQIEAWGKHKKSKLIQLLGCYQMQGLYVNIPELKDLVVLLRKLRDSGLLSMCAWRKAARTKNLRLLGIPTDGNQQSHLIKLYTCLTGQNTVLDIITDSIHLCPTISND